MIIHFISLVCFFTYCLALLPGDDKILTDGNLISISSALSYNQTANTGRGFVAVERLTFEKGLPLPHKEIERMQFLLNTSDLAANPFWEAFAAPYNLRKVGIEAILVLPVCIVALPDRSSFPDWKLPLVCRLFDNLPPSSKPLKQSLTSVSITSDGFIQFLSVNLARGVLLTAKMDPVEAANKTHPPEIVITEQEFESSISFYATHNAFLNSDANGLANTNDKDNKLLPEDLNYVALTGNSGTPAMNSIRFVTGSLQPAPGKALVIGGDSQKTVVCPMRGKRQTGVIVYDKTFPTLLIINLQYEILVRYELKTNDVKCVGTGGVLAAKGNGLSGIFVYYVNDADTFEIQKSQVPTHLSFKDLHINDNIMYNINLRSDTYSQLVGVPGLDVVGRVVKSDVTGKVIASGDFDGDGNGDLLLNTGKSAVVLSLQVAKGPSLGLTPVHEVTAIVIGTLDATGDATLDVLVRIIEPRKAGPLGREVEKSGCLRVMTYAGDKWEELLPILNGSDIVVMNALDEIQCITPGNAPFVAADINGDKFGDFVLKNTKEMEYDVYLGNGRGAFEEKSGVFSVDDFDEVAFYDMDDDGVTDVHIYNTKTLKHTFKKGNGNGGFTGSILPTSYLFKAGRSLQGVLPEKFIDLNGDAKIDVLGIQQCPFTDDRPNMHATVVGFVRTTQNVFEPSFGCGGALEHGRSIITVADLNGDRVSDAIISSERGLQLFEFIGDGPKLLLDKVSLPIAGEVLAITMDLEGDGVSELLLGSSVVRFSCETPGFACDNARRCDTVTGTCVAAECQAATTRDECALATCFLTSQPCVFVNEQCGCKQSAQPGDTLAPGVTGTTIDGTTPVDSSASRFLFGTSFFLLLIVNILLQ